MMLSNFLNSVALGVLLCAIGLDANAASIVGDVVAVADGDTLTVLDGSKVQHKIRLAGIDAPEKKQAYGNRSKQSLSDLVFSRLVTAETDKRDRYGREVGKVTVDGIDANLEQIKRGMAWHYKQYEREQLPLDRALYADAEANARRSSVGLWSDVAATAPWEYRHRK